MASLKRLMALSSYASLCARRPICQRCGYISSKQACVGFRGFASASRKNAQQDEAQRGPFRTRLRTALRRTRVQWYPIPVGLGIGFIGLAQFHKVRQREQKRLEDEGNDEHNRFKILDEEREHEKYTGRPKKRKRIRPTGPWQVQIMSTLPLKALSRVWGRFNELQIPYYLRIPGFKLYSWIFGVNLSEVSEPDLRTYPNLASFFYRTLKPSVRPLDPNPAALLSPADGRVLQFGTIEAGEVEQVKGMTYSLDALLGSGKAEHAPESVFGERVISANNGPYEALKTKAEADAESVVKADEEFARVNGISYTLPNLFSGPPQQDPDNQEANTDVSTTPLVSSEAEVRADLALGDTSLPWYMRLTSQRRSALYYVVVYLAPGDYHRFHSPTAWVAEKRRHFAGELFSVSPYLQRSLPGLFTLNERVVLLGKWRWGFFSFTPVGATNVGSIKINFDRELQTNSLTTDTAADRAAEEAAARGEAYSGFAEASYEAASKLLGGHALKRGEEMGGFQLGSTIVLVFEAPRGERKSIDEGWSSGERKGGWHWNVRQGQKVKVGESLGWVEDQ